MYPNMKHKQTVGLWRSNSFELRGNSDISIRFSSIFKSHEVKIPLSMINPDPAYIKNVNIFSGVLLLLSLLVIAISIGAYIQSPAEKPVMMAMMFIFIPVLMFSARKLYMSARPTLVFFNKDSGANLFGFLESDETQAFIDEMKSRIGSIYYPENITLQQRQTIYLKHLEYLYSESVVTAEEYNDIGQRIEDMKAERNIVTLV